MKPLKKGKAPVKNLVGTMTSWSRRDVLKALGLGGLGIAAGSRIPPLIQHGGEIADSLSLLLSRGVPHGGEHYLPVSFEYTISPKATEKIFTTLELDQKFPETLNVESFHLLAQKVSRLFNLYFEPQSEDESDWEAEFDAYCEQRFQQLLNLCERMHVDFVATLLMWQTSGSNTSSLRAYENDVNDERIRVLVSTAEAIVNPASAGTVISLMRRLRLSMYFGMARLEGPVTLGMHDIEIVMICRGLKNLKETDSSAYEAYAELLQQMAPEFMATYEQYVASHDTFQAVADHATQETRNNPVIAEYIARTIDVDRVHQVIYNGDVVDEYQFLRTTRFWAHICEQQVRTAVKANVTEERNLENHAAQVAIADYENDQIAFVLDQFTNPRFIAILEDDAKQGEEGARLLLELSHRVHEHSDAVIAADRDIAEKLVREQTEQNIEFQLITGTAYTKWLLNEMVLQQAGHYVSEFEYRSPEALAYDTFLASSQRESGGTFDLTGRQPLDRASIPFLSAAELYAQMNEFIQQVYMGTVGQELPHNDMRSFMIKLMLLFEELYMRELAGVTRSQLTRDRDEQRFVEAAQQFGFYRRIFTPPYSSWMASTQAMVGYVGIMGK